MKRRWIIPGFLIGLLLLLAGIWIASYFCGWSISYFGQNFWAIGGHWGEFNFMWQDGSLASYTKGWHFQTFEASARLLAEVWDKTPGGHPLGFSANFWQNWVAIEIPVWFPSFLSAILLGFFWWTSRPKHRRNQRGGQGQKMPAPSTVTRDANDSLVLSYDEHQPPKDHRSGWLIPAFWLGSLTGELAYCALLLWQMRSEGLDEIVFRGLMPPLAVSLVQFVPATLVMGLCLWVRMKTMPEMRYARLPISFISGLIFGLFPWPMVKQLPGDWQVVLVFFGLAWTLLYPLMAGVWLSPRSVFRD